MLVYKSFNIGEECLYWNPSSTDIPGIRCYNVQDVRTGTVDSIRMAVTGGKEYGIKTTEGDVIYIPASSVSEANSGHYCELGPCWTAEKGDCEQ